MKIEAVDAMSQLVEGYRASLADNGHFIASEYNKTAGANIFVFDDDADALVLNKEALATLPHFRVEWDIGYWGGDYYGVGQFVLIPVALVYVFNSPEEAFEKFTGNSRSHIIHYTLDEEFFPDGMEFVPAARKQRPT